jgi:hypothetical protein
MIPRSKPQMTIWSKLGADWLRPPQPTVIGSSRERGWKQGTPACHIAPMQQKTDGRVVRLLTKHLSAEDRSVEQWFLVAIGDDDKAKDAVAKATNASEQVIEIVGHIPAATLAGWGMTEGDVRLVLPGEPIGR